jgi:hypothetical protein
MRVQIIKRVRITRAGLEIIWEESSIVCFQNAIPGMLSARLLKSRSTLQEARVEDNYKLKPK